MVGNLCSLFLCPLSKLKKKTTRLLIKNHMDWQNIGVIIHKSLLSPVTALSCLVNTASGLITVARLVAAATGEVNIVPVSNQRSHVCVLLSPVELRPSTTFLNECDLFSCHPFVSLVVKTSFRMCRVHLDTAPLQKAAFCPLARLVLHFSCATLSGRSAQALLTLLRQRGFISVERLLPPPPPPPPPQWAGLLHL